MKQLLISTAVYMSIMTLIFIGLATCASHMNAGMTQGEAR